MTNRNTNPRPSKKTSPGANLSPVVMGTFAEAMSWSGEVFSEGIPANVYLRPKNDTDRWQHTTVEEYIGCWNYYGNEYLTDIDL